MGIYGKKEKWKRQRADLIRKTGLNKKELTDIAIEFCRKKGLNSYAGSKWHNVSKNQDSFLSFLNSK